MSPYKAQKLVDKLYEQLVKPVVPDNLTGQLVVNTSQGALSGKITITIDLTETK